MSNASSEDDAPHSRKMIPFFSALFYPCLWHFLSRYLSSFQEMTFAANIKKSSKFEKSFEDYDGHLCVAQISIDIRS